jgi:hypothetical protein
MEKHGTVRVVGVKIAWSLIDGNHPAVSVHHAKYGSRFHATGAPIAVTLTPISFVVTKLRNIPNCQTKPAILSNAPAPNFLVNSPAGIGSQRPAA